MKTRLTYVNLCLLLLLGFTACDNNDPDYSDEELAYFERNKAYIAQKKAEVDEEGKLLYQEINLVEESVLYRILEESEEDKSTDPPAENTEVTVLLSGTLIDGTTFQPEREMSFTINQLIPGLALVMLQVHPNEKVEAIIPASLAYGYTNHQTTVPRGSTLIFTFKITRMES